MVCTNLFPLRLLMFDDTLVAGKVMDIGNH